MSCHCIYQLLKMCLNWYVLIYATSSNSCSLPYISLHPLPSPPLPSSPLPSPPLPSPPHPPLPSPPFPSPPLPSPLTGCLHSLYTARGFQVVGSECYETNKQRNDDHDGEVIDRGGQAQKTHNAHGTLRWRQGLIKGVLVQSYIILYLRYYIM